MSTLRPVLLLPVTALCMPTLDEVDSLQPSGQAKPGPMSVAMGLKVTDRRQVGHPHLKLQLAGGDTAIDWGIGTLCEHVGGRIEADFYLQRNVFRGQTRLQMCLVGACAAG